MQRRLEGKIALVTGAGSGIGRASALLFAREGARVVVNDVNGEAAEETVNLIKKDEGEAIFLKADVSQALEVANLIEKIIEIYGRLDCAHNNAGISGVLATTVDYPEDIFDRVISINLKGVWLCLKYEIQHMLTHNSGTIVNTASIEGLIGSKLGSSAYTASKHGVIGITKAAALEYAQSGIRVNAVCPGFVDTPMLDILKSGSPRAEKRLAMAHPIGRLATPEDVAEAVVWLSSDASSFITAHSMVIDGGLTAM